MITKLSSLAVSPATATVTQLPSKLPIEFPVQIVVHEGIPIMRAPETLRARVESLLEKQQETKLTKRELKELERYEQLDDYLSLVNRLVRNQKLKVVA